MPLPGDLETTVHSKVRGTTVMGCYEVKDGTVLLTSADFGEASAPLDGAAPERVAERLLQGLAEAAMARPGAHYMRDDEASAPP